MSLKLLSDPSESEKAKRRAANKFQAVLPRWTLNELVLAESVRSTLEEIIAFHQGKARILDEYGFSRFMKSGTGLIVNFSAPSGTGKSSTAEALAHSLSIGILRVDSGDVISSLLGGSAKALTAIMDQAETENAVLFFDEADSLLGRRFASASHPAEQEINSLKGRLLTRLDSFTGLLIFATNFPAAYDPGLQTSNYFPSSF